MATDLAKLVVSLEVQAGKYAAELDKANQKLARFEKDTRGSLSRIEKGASVFGSTLAKVAGIIASGALFGAIVKATSEAEKSFAQLEAAVKSTGGAAGFTAPQLAKMAGTLQGLTTFSDDAIVSMQSVLLGFTRIRGPEFEGAQQAILDIATRLGTDLTGAASQVGKALNDPIKGLAGLSRVGIQFSADQKKVIEQLVRTGDVAGAQQIILKELEGRFGGAAEAARNNFGGALTGLKNQLGDLLEVKGGLPEATASLNELSRVLADPGVKAGADALFSALITGAAKVVELIGKTVAGLAILAGKGGNAIVDLDMKIDALVLKRDQIEHGSIRLPGPERSRQLDLLGKQLDELKAKQRQMLELGEFSGNARLQEFTPKTKMMIPKADISVEGSDKDRFDFLDFTPTAKKIDTEPMTAFYDQLNDSVKNSSDKAVSEYIRQQVALDELYKVGVVDAEKYAERSAEVLDELLPKFETSVSYITKTVKEKTVEISEFQKQAMRGTVDIIAETLDNGFKDGFSGIVQSFAGMLRKLADQAIAAQIAQKIFGTPGKEGDTGGWLGALMGAMKGGGESSGGGGAGGGGWLSAIAGAFAGGRASGGRVTKGAAYMVGEHGPEPFVPDHSGTIIPHGQMGGGTVNNIAISIAAPQGAVSRQTQTDVAARTARAVTLASRRNN